MSSLNSAQAKDHSSLDAIAMCLNLVHSLNRELQAARLIRLSQTQFERLLVRIPKSSERAYGERTFVNALGPCIDNILIVERHCQRFTVKHPSLLCIIVDREEGYQVWIEKQKVREPKLHDPLKPEFVAVAGQELAQYIGPIAATVCQKAIAGSPDLSRTKFIEIISAKILDLGQAREFKNKLKSL